MADTTEQADPQTPAPEEQEEEQEQEQKQEPTDPPPQEDPATAARSAALTYAADVVELCALAGMPGRAAAFIKAARPLEDIRSELQAARAGADAATEINSHTLPETSAESRRDAKTDVHNSPLVKAAERLAQAGKDRK